MSRHFNFRHYRYMPVGGIFYYFPHFILGIKAAISNAIITASGIAPNEGTVAVSTHFSQQGIFFYFNPPALVFCQVPMKEVHFMKGYVIDVFFYERNGKHMPTHIEVHATISKTWCILDAYRWN